MPRSGSRILKKARLIRPGEYVGGKKVMWAISDYLRDDMTEVRLEGGPTRFFRSERRIVVVKK